jgi:hypothetical protein
VPQKSQRRIFEKSAKNFQKVSEEFLKSQRRIFKKPAKNFYFCSLALQNFQQIVRKFVVKSENCCIFVASKRQ